MFLAIIFNGAGIPLSFIYWYYALYTKNRKTSFGTPSLLYWWWFWNMFLAVVWSGLYASGIVPGAWGFFSAFRMYAAKLDEGDSDSKKTLYGTLTLFAAIMWTIVCLLQLYVLVRMYRWYKGSGGRNVEQSDVVKAGARAAGSSEAGPLLAGAAAQAYQQQ